MFSLAALALTGAAWSMEVTTTPSADDSRILTTTASEPFLSTTLGYQRGFALGDRALGLSATVTAPVFLLDGRHHRLAIAGRTTALQRRSLRLDTRLGLYEQSTDSALVRGTALGTRASAIGGWFGERAFAAAEASLAWSPAARLAPTAQYDALWGAMESGWYADAAGSVTLAVQGGAVIKDRVELTGRAGVDRTLGGGGRIAPLYLGLGVNVWL